MWRVVLLSWWLLGTLALCCPPDCRCFTDDDGYKVANCSRTGLLTGGLFPTIDVLNFKNQLRGSQTKLEARIFRNFRGLQVLNLQNSSISHLPNDVFLGIGRVVRIDLSFNKIKHLNGVVFKPLQNLKELNLRGNSLSMSPLEVIVSDTLEHLDMGYCNINSLPLYTFSSVPNLRHLILDGNSIQTIEYNVLPKGLTFINLASNHIDEPPINVFNSLRYLFRLDISRNPINCSCALLAFQDSLSGRAGILENGVTCANPPHLVGRSINSVNENQLCRDDYAKKEGLNSLIHSRRSRYHHHYYDIQSDEPLMGDESYGTRDAAEVMFTNDETNQMGTHMEARMGTHLGEAHSETYDDKLLETMDRTTASTDKYDVSPEADSSLDLMVDHHPSSPDEVEDVQGSSPEELTEAETNISPREPTPPESSIVAEDLHLNTEESYSGNDNIIHLSTSDPSGGRSDHSNTLHALDVRFNTTDSSSSIQETDEQDWHTSDVESDAEVLANSTQGDEPSSKLELAYEDTTTESSSGASFAHFTLPTSATESADYSYDTQHGDYGSVDNATSSEVTEDESPTFIDVSSSTASSPEADFEGSGESEVETTSEKSPSSSPVGFMEEQETETVPSLQTVSDDLIDVSSTTSYDAVTLLQSSTDASSSMEPSTELPTEPSEPSSSEVTSMEPSTEASSSEPSTDASSSEPSTDASSSEPSTDASSSETSTDASSSEPSTHASSSEPSTDASSSEPSTDASSSEASTGTYSSEPSTELSSISSSAHQSSTPEETTEQPTTESSTELPTTEISLDASSAEPMPEQPEVTIKSSTSETPSSSSSESPSGFWWDSDEDMMSPSSSATTPSEDPTSDVSPTYRKGKMIEFTTEATKDNEIEVIETFEEGAKNGKISVDPSRSEEEDSYLTSGITFILIGVLIAIVMVLLTIIMCRKKKTTKKVRLPPVDPEAANGTELQDMLLPKPPENGIKVLPKAYTNGSTPVSNGKAKEPEVDKEETVPVLAPEPQTEPEPEPAWDDKPEPIEAVTARLTMLARPQTPIFIQKSLT